MTELTQRRPGRCGRELSLLSSPSRRGRGAEKMLHEQQVLCLQSSSSVPPHVLLSPPLTAVDPERCPVGVAVGAKEKTRHRLFPPGASLPTKTTGCALAASEGDAFVTPRSHSGLSHGEADLLRRLTPWAELLCPRKTACPPRNGRGLPLWSWHPRSLLSPARLRRSPAPE